MNRETIDRLADQANSVQPRRAPRRVAPFEPFPVEYLPEPVRSFVRTASDAIGCDPSYVAMPLLAALASLIGNSRRLCIKPGWTEPPILWIALIGDSGSMKTPAFHTALGPILALQSDEVRAAADRWQQYERELALYELDSREWKNKPEGDPPRKPVEPQPSRFVVSDTTVEALAQVLANNWRGVLLQRDELGGWIASFDRYAQGGGQGDVSHWLSMYNAAPIFVDRKTGNRPSINVERAAVCIAGGIQPQTLRRVIGIKHRENGLLARFVFAYPPKRRKQWSDRGLPPNAAAHIESLCDGLRNLEPTVLADDQFEPVELRFSADAMIEWKKFFNDHADEQFDLSGDLAAAWSKLEALPARLALVFHCIRSVSDDSSLDSHDAVDASSLRPAIELSRWFSREARRVYAMLDEDAEQSRHRQFVETIERSGGTVTVREWQRRRSKPTKDDAVDELKELEEAGYGSLRFLPQSGRGRPIQAFSLHSEDFNEEDMTDTNADSESPDGFVSVSESTDKSDVIRRLIAQLLIELRRSGYQQEAITVRDEWNERLAGGIFENNLDERASQSFAFDAVKALLLDDPHFRALHLNGRIAPLLNREIEA